MEMSVRLRGSMREGKVMEKEEEDSAHPLREACELLNFGPEI